LKGLFTIDLA